MLIIFRICLFLVCLYSSSSYSQYLPSYKNINKKDEAGRKQGFWVIYGIDRKESGYDDSTIVEEGYYIDDRKEGEWFKYDEDGILKRICQYKNNRPFDPTISVEQSSRTISIAACTFKPMTEPEPEIVEEKFVPPHVTNWPGYTYWYSAPKYSTQSYFPVLYIGKPITAFEVNHFGYVYPNEDELATIIDHTDSVSTGNTVVTNKNLEISFVPKDRFFVPQPMGFGEDTMEYHSASTIILRNISQDTLSLGRDLVLNLKMQYLDDNKWIDLEANPSVNFLLPGMKGCIKLYPGEIVVTAVPLFEDEHRKLRLVIGNCISDEFRIIWN